MAREITIRLGVLADLIQPATKWGEPYWRPSGVMPPHSGHAVGDVLFETEKQKRYFMGNSILTCHASDTEAYVFNFESVVPAIYVVLRRDEERRSGLPWYVHAVTASPYEGQDYADNAEDIVERVEMPPEVAREIMAFVDEHHREQPFRKRKRSEYREENLKFGKEPIFLNRSRKRIDG